MKILGKTENTILHGLTQPTRNHNRRASVNTFLDFSTNIFYWATNFARKHFKVQLLLHAKPER